MPGEWLRNYRKDIFASDLLAGIIVTIMLIPQSLAYALLAGLPAEMGLYASILPLIAYALLGSSRTLSCLLYTSPSPRDLSTSRMPSSA